MHTYFRPGLGITAEEVVRDARAILDGEREEADKEDRINV
jgi:hypothetical protein